MPTIPRLESDIYMRRYRYTAGVISLHAGLPSEPALVSHQTYRRKRPQVSTNFTSTWDSLYKSDQYVHCLALYA